MCTILFFFLLRLWFRPSQHLPKDDDPVYLIPMPKSKGDKSKNRPPSKVQLQLNTVDMWPDVYSYFVVGVRFRCSSSSSRKSSIIVVAVVVKIGTIPVAVALIIAETTQKQ